MAYTLNRVGGSAGEFASIYVSGITQSGNTVTALTPSGLTKTAVWETHQTINPEWKGLPSGYTQVEYIQSSGTQYIDTGVAATLTTTLEASYLYTGFIQDMMLAGFYNGSSNDSVNYYGYYNSSESSYLNFAWGCTNNYVNVGYGPNVKHIFKAKGASVTFDDTVYSLSGSGAFYNLNYYLCCRNVNTRADCFAPVKIFYIKIYDADNILLRDFIPCINSSNVAGLYDIVNNQFYANSGTGSFTAGNEIPKYITSTGWFLNNLDEYGLYTVTASTTGKSVSDTILIDFATVFTLHLEYLELYLYDEGEEFISTTGGWTLYKDQYATGSQKNATNVRLYWSGSSNICSSNVYTTNAIDVTKYSTLHVRWVCDSIYRSSSYYGWGMSDKISGNDLFSLRTTLAETTTTIDISSYTTLQPNVSQYGASVYLYEMWLD